jgi:hypothetical protein
MTQNEIIEMAKQAGFSDWAIQTPNDLIAFAKLVAEKEREACAKVCEDSNTWDLYDPNGFAANLIRARKQT